MKPPASGPPIIATGMTAIIRPMYLLRSRGGIISPMIDSTPTIRPPAPRPCTARKATSSPMFCDIPASAEPARNTTTDETKVMRRPKRSPSLPQIGVDAVEARM
jgi:hypothetical protein